MPVAAGLVTPTAVPASRSRCAAAASLRKCGPVTTSIATVATIDVSFFMGSSVDRLR